MISPDENDPSQLSYDTGAFIVLKQLSYKPCPEITCNEQDFGNNFRRGCCVYKLALEMGLRCPPASR